MLVCCADRRTSHFIYVYTLRFQLSIISVNCHAQQIKSIEKFKFSSLLLLVAHASSAHSFTIWIRESFELDYMRHLDVDSIVFCSFGGVHIEISTSGLSHTHTHKCPTMDVQEIIKKLHHLPFNRHLPISHHLSGALPLLCVLQGRKRRISASCDCSLLRKLLT